MSIRSLSLPLVNKLFRNYSDALCHQILSVFLVGLHGAVQAASQAPESQASSKTYTPIILNNSRQTPAPLRSYLQFPLPARHFYRHFHVLAAIPRETQRAPGLSSSSSPWRLSWEESYWEIRGLPSKVQAGRSAQVVAGFWEHQA